jgi:hypothetical protein
MQQASMFEIYSNMPLPHFEFLDESAIALNNLFVIAFGGAIGIIISYVIFEIIRIIKE